MQGNALFWWRFPVAVELFTLDKRHQDELLCNFVALCQDFQPFNIFYDEESGAIRFIEFLSASDA